LQDANWHYLYDDAGNLIKKSKNNSEQILTDFKKEQAQSKPQKTYWIDRLFGYTDEPPKPDLAPKTPKANWQYGEWFYTWQANGMLQSVKDPKGKTTAFEYDALGRRTAKINVAKNEINRYIYDGNVLLHEFSYPIADKPKVIADDLGRLSLDREENTDNLITWVFDEGTFVPQAKIVNGETYSIISDYIGRPVQAYNELGNLVWETEYDIYGGLRNLKGDKTFIPFRQLGQYEDVEIGLYYNRFRYYSPDTGSYISQDPIGLHSGEPNFYAYVHDSNSWIDPFGLTGIIYLRTDPNTGAEYVGKSKNPKTFENREYSHNRKLRKSTGDPTAEYKFKKLETDIVGKDKLAFREETNIRQKGGIAKDGGPLENKIHGQADGKYKAAGGDMDKLGNKIKGCH
jgi:RHS repeat-associated protein